MSSTDLNPPTGPAAFGRGHGYGRDSYTRNGPDFPGRSWLGKAEGWLDDRGKGAWIAAMVLGFIFFWPVGLALLAYMIWSKRMFRGCAPRGRHFRNHPMAGGWGPGRGFSSSGNNAFDSYKADTLRRLEEEQEAFEAFLNRLRDAKDKAEFDQFMDERARRAREENTGRDDSPEATA